MSEHRRTLGWTVAWALLFGWCLRPIWGIDIFGHVVIGRWILESGIPTSDVLSAAHPEAPWTPFQVGYEVLVAWVDGLAGLDGLRVLHGALFATGLLGAVRFVGAVTGSAGAGAFVLALLLVTLDDRIRLRPHAINLVFEVFLLIPLASGRWRQRPGLWGAGAVGVALIWATFHGAGALWLVAVVGTVLVAGTGAGERRWALWTLGGTVAAIAVAPGALGGLGFLAGTANPWAAAWVPELAPSWAFFGAGLPGGVGWICGLAPWVALVAIVEAGRGGIERHRLPTFLAAGGLLLGALLMARLVYYAPLAMALVWPELSRRRMLNLPARGRVLAAAGGLLVLPLLVAHVPRWSSANPWTTTVQPGFFPETEASALAQAGIGGRIFNATDWGGYLLYSLYPDAAVLSDGRVAFSEDVAEILTWDMERPTRMKAAEAAYERYGIDLMVRRRADRGGGVFPGGGPWELLLRGPEADIWSRRGPSTEARKVALSRVLESGRPPGGQRDP